MKEIAGINWGNNSEAKLFHKNKQEKKYERDNREKINKLIKKKMEAQIVLFPRNLS